MSIPTTSQQIDRVAWMARALDDVRDVLEPHSVDLHLMTRGPVQVEAHLTDTTLDVASAVADALGFDKLSADRLMNASEFIHHRWSGDLGGFHAQLIWLEHAPMVKTLPTVEPVTIRVTESGAAKLADRFGVEPIGQGDRRL
jgi:hypothetical protein